MSSRKFQVVTANDYTVTLEVLDTDEVSYQNGTFLVIRDGRIAFGATHPDYVCDPEAGVLLDE